MYNRSMIHNNTNEGQTMETRIIPAPCRMCNEIYCVEVEAEGYQQWKAGALIQNALPNLTPDERELLISKTCDDCWNKLFPENDE